ncbi:MAG: N-acetylmuramoyl-L-alanine amidase [Candidatus Woesearchaeota archaeon]
MHTKKIFATAAILLAEALFPLPLNAPLLDERNIPIYVSSTLPLESRIKSEDAVIVIDPGHDDKYVGRHANGQKEEAINLEFAKKMKKSLEDMGGTVYMTRNSGARMNINNLNLDDKRQIDVKDELTARAKYISGIPYDLGIIIHQNYYPKSSSVNGMEIYVYGIRNNRQLTDDKLNYTKIQNCKIFSEPALLVAEKLGQYLSEQGIKVSVIGSDMKILKYNSDKVVLYLEMGYMSNKTDLNNITNPEWQDNMTALLTDFFEENIAYIKKVNTEYDFKKNLGCILMPPQESVSEILDKMMKEIYAKK